MGKVDSKQNGAGRWYALAALAASTLFALAVAAAAWIYHSYGPGVDFASYWAAGRLALAGQPSLAYDVEAHRAIEMTVANMGGLMPFPYPPPFLFAVSPFAFHPFWLAYLLWMAVTAGLYFAGTRLFVAPRYAFAHPAALVNAVIGQNGFLTSSIFLFGIAALATRPFAAGAILGLLVIKPQLALLVPVALLAARQWRAIGGAAVSSLALLGLAAIIFGLDSYRGFIAIGGDYGQFMAADRWNWAEQASVFGFFRFFGVPQVSAFCLQGIAALAAAILTWRSWAQRHEQRGAILAAATLLVPPYVFTYDSLLLILPLAVLLGEPERRWRAGLAWLLLALPLLNYFGLYPGPNTVPIASGLCLWWLSAGSTGKKKAAAP